MGIRTNKKINMHREGFHYDLLWHAVSYPHIAIQETSFFSLPTPSFSHLPFPPTCSSLHGCDSYYGNRNGMERCCHADASVRVGGILGHPGPFPSLSREKISVNDIHKAAASLPHIVPIKGRQIELYQNFLVKSCQIKSNWNGCWSVSANFCVTWD